MFQWATVSCYCTQPEVWFRSNLTPWEVEMLLQYYTPLLSVLLLCTAWEWYIVWHGTMCYPGQTINFNGLIWDLSFWAKTLKPYMIILKSYKKSCDRIWGCNKRQIGYYFYFNSTSYVQLLVWARERKKADNMKDLIHLKCKTN
jgi:hypothetical protein